MAENDTQLFQVNGQKRPLASNLDGFEEITSTDELGAAEAGADLDLQRSSEAVGLNELLYAYGIDDAAADALLTQSDDHQGLLAPNSNAQQEVNTQLQSRSLVVIDQSVSNWRELAVSAPTACEVLILNKQHDGIRQISDHLLQRRLNGYSELDALSIVSSRGNGDLQLGSSQLDAGGLYSYTNELADWKDALSIREKITVFDGLLPGNDETATLSALLSDLISTAVNDGDTTQTIAQSAGVTSPDGQTAEISQIGAYGNATVEHFCVVGQELVNDLNAYSNLQEALGQTNKVLTELPNRSDFSGIVKETFGQAGTEEQRFEERLKTAEADLRTQGLGITVELRSEKELKGAKGAYAALEPSTQTERIYLNADWINQGISSLAIALVLLEESGQAWTIASTES